MMHYKETKHMMEKFKKAKFNEEQTEVILEAVELSHKDGMENLATKEDIFDVKQEISKVELKIADVKSELERGMHNLEIQFTKLDGSYNTLKWMFGFMITISLTTLGVLIRLSFSQ